MQISIDTSAGELETDRLDGDDYDDEVLCAGWNPSVLALVETAEFRSVVPNLPINSDEEDLDAFLDRMYVCQEG